MPGQFKHTPVDFGYSDLETVTKKSGRLYTSPDGTKYPSITTVLGSLNKDALHEWRARVGEKEANRISSYAANRGTKVHDLMEKYVKGEDIDLSKMMPHHKKSFKCLSEILDKHLTEVYAQEAALYSEFLGIAGRVDLVGIWDGVTSIIDFKTSMKVKEKAWISNYFMQASAYAIMFEERTGIAVPNIVIVMDVDGSDPIVFKEHRDNWDKELIRIIKEFYRLEGCKVI